MCNLIYMIVKRQKLYSDLEQREFNSKSMKALRKTWDLQKGIEAGGLIPTTGKPMKIDEITNRIRAIGREYNRGYNRQGIHGSILAKTDPMDVHSLVANMSKNPERRIANAKMIMKGSRMKL